MVVGELSSGSKFRRLGRKRLWGARAAFPPDCSGFGGPPDSNLEGQFPKEPPDDRRTPRYSIIVIHTSEGRSHYSRCFGHLISHF